MVRRLDCADGLLVTDALRINQRFVQNEQWVVEVLQSLLDIGFHFTSNVSHFAPGSKPGEDKMA